MVESINTFEGETGAEAPVEAEAPAPSETVEEASANETPEAVLPEKFSSVEDLVKSYNELESKLGQSSEEPQEQPEQQAEQAEDEAREVLEQRGLDFDEMSAEFARDSVLSEERYQQLEEAGIPRNLVDQFIEGQKAVGQQIQEQAFQVVGGQDNYNNMVSWAQANMSEGEIESFNRAVEAGDMNDKMLAVRGLYSRFTSENGSSPNLRHGASNNGGATDVYDSWAQVTQDMRDARYKNDPAFRAVVEDRLNRSGSLS